MLTLLRCINDGIASFRPEGLPGPAWTDAATEGYMFNTFIDDSFIDDSATLCFVNSRNTDGGAPTPLHRGLAHRISAALLVR